jgi:hypothetical protein|tara:strand:- start:1561 stop:1839 length:279 start_codon:yes stop_codon:yes gene_type:complete
MGKTIVDRVYRVDELIKIFGDIIEDYINQVVLMSDEEIEEDRGDWIKRYSNYRVDDEYNYDVSIHTLAIEIEQIRRDGKIYYDIPKKNVRLD